MITKSCIACGVDFEVDDTKRNWQSKKLCSTECQKTHTNTQSRLKYTQIQWPQKKVCIKCDADFLIHEGGNMAQKYCGMECQRAEKLDRQARKLEAKRVAKQCAECGCAFLPGKFTAHVQRYCSHECRSLARNKQQYEIGATKSKIRNGYKYDFKTIRPQVLERDGHKCVVCNGTERLHAHHWDNSGGTEQVDNSRVNLGTLCGVCHYAIHSVTLAFINGKWVLDGKIFELLGLTGEIPIKT